MIELWIIGAGGHAKVVIDTVRSSDEFTVAGVVDDDPQSWSTDFCGVEVIGPITCATFEAWNIKHAVLAIGDNQARAELSQRFDACLTWAVVVHAKAYVASGVEVGKGTVVFAGAIIQPSSSVGEHAIINTSCSIDHDCVIQDFVHIGPGARIAGRVDVGSGSLIGVGASLLPGVTIGEWSLVGGGAVVVKNVPVRSTAIGVPATFRPQSG